MSPPRLAPPPLPRLECVLARAAALWHGPPGLPGALRMEWRFVMIRWVGLLAVTPGLVFLRLPAERPTLAYLVLLTAAIYNAILQRALSRRQAERLVAVLTTIGDSALIVTMLVALGGGFDSPFSPFLFVIVVSVAMRFGYRPSLAAAVLFIAANVAIEGARPLDASLFFRSGFLILAALMASFIVEQGRADKAALQSSHDELRGAYARLAAAHQELLQVDQMKSDFIANVSHEIRTPLASVLAYSEILLGEEDVDSQTTREFLGVIHGESQRLTRLIEDVLDISRIESGAVQLRNEDVVVSEIVAAVARLHREAIERRGLVFRVDVADDLPTVRFDPDRLQQVLGNLLENAAKFTREGTIRLSAVRVGDEVQLAVADSGIGIPPEHHERVFERFQQVGDLMTDKPGGTGLGLAICAELVRSHGGRIWLESAPGVGSTFTVALPATGPIDGRLPRVPVDAVGDEGFEPPTPRM